MTVRVEVSPGLLVWARERSRMSLESLAAKPELAKLREWETGERQPTLKQLEKFATATHTPVGYLLLQEPPVEELPVADFRTFPGTTPTRPSPDLLETIYACEQRQEWYQTFALQHQLDALDFVGSVTSDDDIVASASAMRAMLDFDIEDRSQYSTWTAALSGLAEHAESAGVLVMINGVVGTNTHRKLDPQEFRGFALADDLAPVVFVNGADTKAAQIFTLAHELAHLWLGVSGVSNPTVADEPGADDEIVERWCNQVAAEVLVPREAFRDEVIDVRDLSAELDRLARRYKVSTLVILRRMRDTQRLTAAEFRTAYATELERVMSLRGDAGSGGNFYNTQPIRVSKRFALALINSTLEGQTLHRDAFRLLGLKKIATFNELGEKLGVC